MASQDTENSVQGSRIQSRWCQRYKESLDGLQQLIKDTKTTVKFGLSSMCYCMSGSVS